MCTLLPLQSSYCRSNYRQQKNRRLLSKPAPQTYVGLAAAAVVRYYSLAAGTYTPAQPRQASRKNSPTGPMHLFVVFKGLRLLRRIFLTPHAAIIHKRP